MGLSVIVPEEALVKLIIAHVLASAELELLAGRGITIDNDRLIPDLTPHILDLIGCPRDSTEHMGLWDVLAIDLESVMPTPEAARGWLQEAREKIAQHPMVAKGS